jgi:hypothetical protein
MSAYWARGLRAEMYDLMMGDEPNELHSIAEDKYPTHRSGFPIEAIDEAVELC